MTTPREIAQWMLAQIDENDELLQVDAVTEIQRLFSSEFVYVGNYGELSIDTRVLYQFRKLSGEAVVWVTENNGSYWSGAHWRKRQQGDSPGRRQDRW
jgi:hypothetical protein